MVGLKSQSPRGDKKRLVQMIAKFTRLKICLNMNSKTDKDDRSCDDLAFLSEIISDFRFWQDTFTNRKQK
jgi:hypothetical protein